MRYGAGAVEGGDEEGCKRRKREPEEEEAAAGAEGGGEGGPDREGSDAAVFDLEILECTICTEPLAAPIYQCANGHVACAACCAMTDHVCPSCTQPTGAIRCLALEKLIESLRVKCQFAVVGCPALVPFSSKASHERLCSFAPLSCPFPQCSHFQGPYHLLQAHVQRCHPNQWSALALHAQVTFVMTPSDRFHFLFHSGLYFVLHRRKSSFGDMCYLTLPKVLSPRYATASCFPFRLQLQTLSPGDAGDDGGISSTFKVDAHCCLDDSSSSPPPHGFVVVPEDKLVDVAVMFLPPRPSPPSVLPSVPTTSVDM